MIGRDAQRRRIKELLSSGSSVALHAAPATGKSWLSDQVVTHLGDSGIEATRFDLSTQASGAEVFGVIAQSLGLDSAPESDLRKEWQRLRLALASRSSLLVLTLDEFDAVTRFADAADFLTLLRELLHRPWELKCSAFIVSRRPLEQVESEVRGISTLATLCFPEYLGAVLPEELRTSWSGAFDLTDSEIDSCMAWSAGYPPLVRYWLAARPDRSLGGDDAHGGQQQALHFGRLVDYLETMGLRMAAVQMVLGPVVDDWVRELHQLRALGVLPDGAFENAEGFAKHDVFKQYLRVRSLGLDAWGVLGASELKLRSVIAHLMVERFGPGWCDEGSKVARAVAVPMRAAKAKQAEDERKFGRSGDWLAYTYPQDLGNIVLAHWELFARVFATGDRKYWNERFARLAEYRTPVAHNRVEMLSAPQRALCQAYAEEVVRAIDGYMSAPATS